MFPRPRLCRFGRRNGRDSQMWPNVSEPASPQSAASGIAPMPAPSRTIKIMRSKDSVFVMLKSWLPNLALRCPDDQEASALAAACRQDDLNAREEESLRFSVLPY